MYVFKLAVLGSGRGDGGDVNRCGGSSMVVLEMVAVEVVAAAVGGRYWCMVMVVTVLVIPCLLLLPLLHGTYQQPLL